MSLPVKKFMPLLIGIVSQQGGQDGEAITATKNIQLPVKVSIGGIDAQILGAVLIYTGEIQVNVVIPNNAPTGAAPLMLTIGTAASRKDATIAIK